MKRIGSLFDVVFSRENLYSAYLDARRGKRKKRACFQFEIELGANLANLYEEIYSANYKPMPYFKFIIYEPKERIIHAPAFRDIVVQHAIYRVVYPIFDKTFIDTSFACRLGYGTHRASNYTQGALRACRDEDYILKLDIKKFFYSIDREILRRQIERKIKDKRLVDIMMLFAEKDEPIGIPIGNLLSQIYALIYLNPLDHFIKRVLKVTHYVRYVDDFILIGLSRDKCLEYKSLIVDFLKNELGLELSKSTIQKVKRGVNFVGYRTWKNKRLIRKYSLYKFKRSVKQEKQASAVSLLGHAKQTNSLNYMLKIIKDSSIGKGIVLPKSYRRLQLAKKIKRSCYV
ncbi:hypothetical protein D4R42_03100 [bacterium]|nr:MAG: hypothetical protein D4R42_03100 [bacterium]